MKKYFNFVKIEHSLFSLPIVFSGAFLALTVLQERPSLSFSKAFWIFLAIVGARSAGFALNRIVDRDIDAQNPRTQGRDIPSGNISVFSAWLFVLASSALFIFSAAMISKLCLFLSPIPLILFWIYPYLKRSTFWCHLGLGIAWGIAPLGGWCAVTDRIGSLHDLVPIFLLSFFSVLWVAGFDIVYALLDEEFDRRRGIHSMPAAFGKANALRIARVFHFAAVLALGTLVELYLHHPLAYVFLATAGFLLVLSHWKVATKPLTPSVIDFAFFKVNAALGFVVFLLIVA